MNVINAEIVYVNYEDINTEDNINNLKDIKTGEEQEINQENILEEQPINNSQKILKNNNNSDSTISSSTSTPPIPRIVNYSPRIKSRTAIRTKPIQVVESNVNNTRGIRSRSAYNNSINTNNSSNSINNSNTIDNTKINTNSRSSNNSYVNNNSDSPRVRTRESSNNVTARAGTLYKGRVSASGGNYMVGARVRVVKLSKNMI